MLLEEFDYDLPDEAIAQTPVEPRDSARLLVDHGSRPAEHRHVSDLTELLSDGDVLVVNDSRVIPARLAVQRATGGAVEILLLEPLDETRRVWDALARPARKLGVGEQLFTADGAALIEVGERGAAGDTVHVTVLGEADPLDTLAAHGTMPLPPYITTRLDRPDRYQTVYAADPGSAAAPTAGLHFTPGLLAALGHMGVQVAPVELMVGLDTFKPVSENDPRDHQIHTERYRVPAETQALCENAKRVVAVGTTSVRAVETAANTGQREGRSQLFIHRPYQWRAVDLMMTNFHLPRTTLLLMIDAFVGNRWRSLYQSALAEGYRFLSFGDAMLLDRRAS